MNDLTTWIMVNPYLACWICMMFGASVVALTVFVWTYKSGAKAENEIYDFDGEYWKWRRDSPQLDEHEDHFL